MLFAHRFVGTCLLSAVVVHERSANVLVDCVIGGSEMVSVDLDISRVWATCPACWSSGDQDQR